MGGKPKLPQSPGITPGQAFERLKEASPEQKAERAAKKLEKERIEQERARFGGGGSLLAPDQKSQLGG